MKLCIQQKGGTELYKHHHAVYRRSSLYTYTLQTQTKPLFVRTSLPSPQAHDQHPVSRCALNLSSVCVPSTCSYVAAPRAPDTIIHSRTVVCISACHSVQFQFPLTMCSAVEIDVRTRNMGRPDSPSSLVIEAFSLLENLVWRLIITLYERPL